MEYLVFDIPYRCVVSKPYKINETQYIVPSKRASNNGTIDTGETFISYLFIEKEEFESKKIKDNIRDFVVFLNFVWYDDLSAIWLNKLDIKSLLNDIQEIDTVESLLMEYSLVKNDTLKGVEMDLENHKPPFYNYNSTFKINAVELFIKFNGLKRDNKLRQQIELFSFAVCERALLGAFYNNGNLEISLLYALLDSIMKDTISDDQKIKKCQSCGYETRRKKRDKERIKEFCQITFKGDSKKAALFEKIIRKHYHIRNNFFHEGKSESNQEIISEGFRLKKFDTGESIMNIEEELEYSNGRLLGRLNIRALIGDILIQQLIEC